MKGNSGDKKGEKNVYNKIDEKRRSQELRINK